eukprot:535299-Amphidinium_carterae.1
MSGKLLVAHQGATNANQKMKKVIALRSYCDFDGTHMGALRYLSRLFIADSLRHMQLMNHKLEKQRNPATLNNSENQMIYVANHSQPTIKNELQEIVLY